MSTLNSVFDIAKTALLTTQKAINVTSHNISNANTPGYTRQKPVLESMQPVNYGGLYFGTGVEMQDIERVYDNFQNIQLRGASSSLSRYETKGQHLAALESIINDFDGSGLSSRLDSFFNSFQDIATSPSSYGERAALLSNASVLADTFNNISTNIDQNISNINKGIEAKVKDINSLASQIADLNQQISTSETAGVSSNDLRDKRDLLLESLSGYMDISIMENASGQMDVYAGGSFLVAGNKTASLSLEINNDNPDTYNIVSNGSVINNRISGGSLKGDLDGIAYYKETEGKVNLLGAALVKEVNIRHAEGYGLDGSTGADFFAPLAVYTRGNTSNTGGAVVSSGSVTALDQLTLDDYEVRFSGAGAYNVVNLSTKEVVTGGAYASGSAITFDGLSVTITSDSGAPAAGDRFKVSVTENAARDMGVSVTDPDKVAASSTSAGTPGDNTNALALAALKDGGTVSGTSFNQFYNSIVTGLGISAREAKVNHQAQGRFVEELRTARDSTSGVSIEEEAINLVKLQRAYEAAAKVMQTVDQMMETLLNLR